MEPKLADAAREFAKRWAVPLTQAEVSLFQLNGEVKSASLLGLLVWTELRKIEQHYSQSVQAERSWTKLASAVVDGQMVQYFKSLGGSLVALPEAFVRAFLGGKRLDAELVDDEEDTSQVRLLRGGKQEAVFPKTLLDYLTELAGRECRDLPGNPISRPVSHSSGTGYGK